VVMRDPAGITFCVVQRLPQPAPTS
jgi:hypothetical protein